MLEEISSRQCYEMKRVPLGVIFPSRPSALFYRRPSDQEPQYRLERYYSSFYLRTGEGDEHCYCLIDTAVVLRNLGGNATSSKIPQETCYASFYTEKPYSFSTRASKHSTILKEIKLQRKRDKENVNFNFLHIIRHSRKQKFQNIISSFVHFTGCPCVVMKQIWFSLIRVQFYIDGVLFYEQYSSLVHCEKIIITLHEGLLYNTFLNTSLISSTTPASNPTNSNKHNRIRKNTVIIRPVIFM